VGDGDLSSYLEIRNLSHSFSFENEETDVFQDVSITLDKGEFLCILGRSGCGKTTLLRCLAGLITPTAGEILIEGELITNPGKHCAMVFQSFDQLLPWKTVFNNVIYPLVVKRENRVEKSEAKEIAEKYLEMVGLSKYLDYYPHQLSGGMKQRVAIARALAMRPSLILMDEPFASLDADSRSGLQKELLRIWKASEVTVLFVTHSIIEAIGVSTKFLVMGEYTESVKAYMDNPVEGERGILKTPQSPGYPDCWAFLSNAIRSDAIG